MKRAFFVLGAESTGTKLMMQCLIACGCHGGADTDQYLDNGFHLGKEVIAFRRSVPHRKQWPDITKFIRSMRTEGYRVRCLVMVRDWHAMSQSQFRWGHVKHPDIGMVNAIDAYCHIISGIHRTMTFYELISYESLVGHPAYLHQLLKRLNLKPVHPLPTFENRNAKHYGDKHG